MSVDTMIIERMSNGSPFTFYELWSGISSDQDVAYRPADRLIQKWRKLGYISFVREGRKTIWSLTEKGREYASSLRNRNG